VIFFLKKKFEFSILQRFVQICVYSAINGHFCKKKKTWSQESSTSYVKSFGEANFAMNQANRDTCPM
jgi:hypothetical protein